MRRARRRALGILVWALAVLWPGLTAAQPSDAEQPAAAAALPLTDASQDPMDLLPQAALLAAPLDTPIEVLRRPEVAARFQPSAQFGRPRSTDFIWARLRLRPAPDGRNRWVLHVSSTILSGWAVTAHWQEHQAWQRLRISGTTPLDQRPLPDAAAIFDLERLTKENHEIYFSFERQVIGNLYLYQSDQFYVETYQHLYKNKMLRIIFYGFIFGICAIIIIYGVILFISTRDRSSAWFSASMLGFVLYFLSREGIGFEILWGHPPWIKLGIVLAPLGGVISSLTISRFTVNFLNIGNRRHWVSIVTSICIIVMSLNTLALSISLFRDIRISYVPYNLCAIIVSVSLVSLVCSRLRSGDPALKWVLAAFVAAASGVVLQTLVLTSALPPRLWNRHAMPIGLVVQVKLLAIALAYRMRNIQRTLVEREKSERLLLTMLPAPIAQRLKAGESPIADRHAEVTVLFADIAGFTPLSSELPPEQVVRTLNTLFSRFDALTSERGLEKIKTIGDCYMVVGGLPSPRPDHAEAVADLALALLAAVDDSPAPSDPGLRSVRIRIGLHCGSAVAGVIGTHKPAYDLWGDTVNTASRMESHGEPGRIHCSQAVYDKLAPSFEFSERRELEIRGKGRLPTYFLLRRRPV